MFLRSVLLPFAWTRLLLVWVAWFGTQLSSSWSYPAQEGARRGWEFAPWLPLDVFGRWDTGWYMDLAEHGYLLRGPLERVQSNVAFFPLYPWAVRGLHALLPVGFQGPLARYLCALAVANAAALLGLSLLWRLALEVTRDEAVASRTVLYTLLFPTGFFLSAAYSESTFLLLSVAALLAARRGRFLVGGTAGLLLALTRPAGVLVAVPLAWMALERGKRKLPSLAASALPGVGLALHAANLWRVTGDPLALVHAQSAWARKLAAPWQTLLHPSYPHAWLAPMEMAALAFVLFLGATLLARRETRALGVWALLSLVPILLSGTLNSSLRFVAVVFPAFLALGLMGRRTVVDRAVVVSFSFGQAVLFLIWSRFFWVA